MNTLGAITTNRIPPQGEAAALAKLSGRVEKYSYDRNIEYLLSNRSKSFVWQTYAQKYVSALNYYWFIAGIISICIAGQIVFLYMQRKPEETQL